MIAYRRGVGTCFHRLAGFFYGTAGEFHLGDKKIRRFKKILFFADGAKGEKTALDRAHDLATTNSAELVVVDVVADLSTNDVRLNSSIKHLQDTLIKERERDLGQLIASLPGRKGKKPAIKKRVVPGKDYIEIIKMVVKEKFDLVIKSVNSKSVFTAALFGDNDIRLFHHCPCPVLILKPSRRKRMHHMLAAVDPVTEDQTGVRLNSEIMEIATSLAEVELADLQVLHVWDLPIHEKTNSSIGKGELKTLSMLLRKDTEQKMDKLVGKYVHVPLQDHLLHGKPHKVIRKFVADNDIDLLIMGTVARPGVPGFTVGNTAERILNHVDCSVLALKPRGWKSPIK